MVAPPPTAKQLAAQQLSVDRRLLAKERQKLDDIDAISPIRSVASKIELQLQSSLEPPEPPIGRPLPPRPPTSGSTFWAKLNEQKRLEEEQERQADERKLRELAKTPIAMVLTRVAQLLGAFADIAAKLESVQRLARSSTLRRGAAVSCERTLTRVLTSARGREEAGGEAASPKGRALANMSRGTLGRRELEAFARKAQAAVQGESPAAQEELLTSLRAKEAANVAELSLIMRFLSEPLRLLPPPLLQRVVRCMQLQQLEQHSTAYVAGDEATALYIVLSGTLEEVLLTQTEHYRPNAPRRLVAVHRRGACCGEAELLPSRRRRTTLACTAACTAVVLSRRDYMDILGAHAVERQGAVKAFLSLKVEGLQRVGEEEVDDVAAAAVRHVIAAGTEIDLLQQRPPSLYFVEAGTVAFEALDHANAPSQHEAQGMMRDACMPTMGDAGVLAGIAISEGGHAEGTLGQAGKLRALVRRLTPKRALGAASEGAVFGGGRAFLGDGAHQESLKVVARTELRVLALPAEAALLLDQGTLVQELRNHLAFQLTYWFSRTNMIDKQTAVGHKQSDTCVQVANGARQYEERRRKDRAREAAASRLQGATPAERPAEHCMRHLERVREEFAAAAGGARVGAEGTPLERFWASPALRSERRAALHRNLAAAFPGKLGPLCKRLDGLASKTEKVAQWEAHEEEVEGVRRANEEHLDRFVHGLRRPMTPAERDTFLRARAGLDVPEGNPLGLRPLSAALPGAAAKPPAPLQRTKTAAQGQWTKVSGASAMIGTKHTVGRRAARKPGDVAAAAALWEHSQGRVVPAVRQLLTHGEIQRRAEQRKEQLQSECGALASQSRPSTAP